LFYKHFFMLDFLGARLFCLCCVETQGHVIGSIVKAKNNKMFREQRRGKSLFSECVFIYREKLATKQHKVDLLAKLTRTTRHRVRSGRENAFTCVQKNV